MVEKVGGGKTGTSFARGTVFNKKPPPDKDGAEKKTTKNHKCVVRLWFKVLHGSTDVQEIMVGLLDYCLMTLQEQDKTACILNRKKTLKAQRVGELPCNFTNFDDDWGMWDEDIKMFLNTIREKGQQAFIASFYFQRNVEPNVSFEKTLLKMAKQSKHKGTVVIEVKPCQYLDTTWEIMFFNLPYCNAVGLQDYICKALVAKKSRLIH